MSAYIILIALFYLLQLVSVSASASYFTSSSSSQSLRLCVRHLAYSSVDSRLFIIHNSYPAQNVLFLQILPIVDSFHVGLT